MSKKRGVLVFLLVIFLVPSLVFADGIEVPYGTRANTLGKAFTAVADDVSAIYWNPAGLTQLKGSGAAIDYLNIKTKSSFTENSFAYPGDNTYNAADKVTHLPNLAYYYALDNFTLAFGMYAISGLTSDYTQTDVHLGAQIGLMNIGPSIGYQVNEELSLGGGLSLVLASTALMGTLNMAAVNPLWAAYGMQDFSLKATGSNWNANLGGLYKINENAKIGLSYRLPQRIILEGKSKFLGNESDCNLFVNVAGKLNAGISYQWPRLKQLITTAEVSVTQWGKAMDNSDADCKDTTVDAIFGARTELNGRNNVSYSLGTEYKINEQLSARFGYMVEGPPTLPSEKISPPQYLVKYSGVAMGGSYDFGRVGFNAGYAFLKGSDLTNNLETVHPVLGVNVNPNTGVYKRNVSLLLLTVYVKL